MGRLRSLKIRRTLVLLSSSHYDKRLISWEFYIKTTQSLTFSSLFIKQDSDVTRVDCIIKHFCVDGKKTRSSFFSEQRFLFRLYHLAKKCLRINEKQIPLPDAKNSFFNNFTIQTEKGKVLSGLRKFCSEVEWKNVLWEAAFRNTHPHSHPHTHLIYFECPSTFSPLIIAQNFQNFRWETNTFVAAQKNL